MPDIFILKENNKQKTHIYAFISTETQRNTYTSKNIEPFSHMHTIIGSHTHTYTKNILTYTHKK